MSYLITFVIAFIFSLILIPIIIFISRKFNWFDSNDHRKIHSGSIPRIGGISIALGFFITIFLMLFILPTGERLPKVDVYFWLMLASGFGFFLLGLIDDFIQLSAWIKFIVQIVLALIIVLSGYSFSNISIPFVSVSIELGVFGKILTVIWIVGICNAINFLDGIDGQAGGVTFIACATWAIFFFQDYQYVPAIIATAAGGAIVGFLFFNFPPANIFMGDSGSYLLGFFLAILPLLGVAGSRKEADLLPALTIALVPILDIIAAILRRLKLRVSFFTPDRHHLHHKLLHTGFSERQTLALVFGNCIILGAAVTSTLYFSKNTGQILLFVAWIIVILFFIFMHIVKENNIRLINNAQ